MNYRKSSVKDVLILCSILQEVKFTGIIIPFSKGAFYEL